MNRIFSYSSRFSYSIWLTILCPFCLFYNMVTLQWQNIMTRFSFPWLIMSIRSTTTTTICPVLINYFILMIFNTISNHLISRKNYRLIQVLFLLLFRKKKVKKMKGLKSLIKIPVFYVAHLIYRFFSLVFPWKFPKKEYSPIQFPISDFLFSKRLKRLSYMLFLCCTDCLH